MRFWKTFSEIGTGAADGVERLTLLTATLRADLDHLTRGTREAQYCWIHASVERLPALFEIQSAEARMQTLLRGKGASATGGGRPCSRTPSARAPALHNPPPS